MANQPTNVFDPVTRPDLATIHDRHSQRPENERVWFAEASFSQAADLNEAFSIEADRRKAIGALVARDGDRLAGGDILVDSAARTVQITDGTVYVDGAPRDIPSKTLTSVPMTGTVQLGIRCTTRPVTANDDTFYLGLEPIAEESFGEPGAIRQVNTYVWAFDTDGQAGQFYPYATMTDGAVVSQDAPPTLSGVQQQIRIYDYDARENYVVRGCTVSALGLSAGAQVFAIAEGTANILGSKIQRTMASRYSEPEAPDLGTIDAEPTTFNDGGTGTATFTVRRPPIAAVTSVIVTKQKTVTLTKGVTNSTDVLPDSSTTEIISVVQGGTTYAVNTSWIKSGDSIAWSPAGAEPSTGSTYQVTYQYLDAVTPTSFTEKTITVSGGVTGKVALLTYSNKLPRTDALCIDEDGNIVYLKGVSAATFPQPPIIPKSLLRLATIKNTWTGKASVTNDAIRAYPFSAIDRMYNNLLDLFNQVALQKQQVDINYRSPASRTGIFSDPLISDDYRDAGATQNGAVFNGSFQIPITPSYRSINAGSTLTLSYVETTFLAQTAMSACEKINPYQTFAPPPAKLSIDPKQDFWTDKDTTWLSEETKVFGTGDSERTVKTETIESVRTEPARFLRQISIDFTINDFGAGETLTTLTFDGINVNPGGLVANASGTITGSFTIPANVTAGVKEVVAKGGSGTAAACSFTGQGRIERIELQKVTTVERFQTPETEWTRWRENVYDPQAQSFVLPQGRHVSSIELKFCAIGNRAKPVRLEIVTVDNGFPTTEVLAQAEVKMTSVISGAWTKFTFKTPIFLPAGRMFAFVVKTDDANHSISVANRGQFDAAAQKWIAAQPYTVGTRFSSSNAISWTVHQDSDITFRMNVAAFSQTTRIVDLGTYTVTNVSDVIVRGDIYLPTGDTKVLFELTFGTEKPVYVTPDQVWERTSFFSGSLRVRCYLYGNVRVSPVVQRNLLLILGTMQANGVYISESFTFGSNVRLDTVCSVKLPYGSALTVECLTMTGWQPVPFASSVAIDNGFVEQTYTRPSTVAPLGGKLRLTLTGTPAARPSVADLRAWTS